MHGNLNTIVQSKIEQERELMGKAVKETSDSPKHQRQSWKSKIREGQDIEAELVARRCMAEKALPYMWDAGEGPELLKASQREMLTAQLGIFLNEIQDPLVLKFLQINIYVALLERIIEEEQKLILKGVELKPIKQRRLASLKVLRKNLLDQRNDGLKRHGFQSGHEVLQYSW